MKDKLADAAVNLMVGLMGVEKNTHEEVISFNSENCMTENTEVIIVGTITPLEGMKNGYFYTAPLDRIYGYIDAARGTGLLEKKRKLTDIGLSRLQKEQLESQRLSPLDKWMKELIGLKLILTMSPVSIFKVYWTINHEIAK